PIGRSSRTAGHLIADPILEHQTENPSNCRSEIYGKQRLKRHQAARPISIGGQTSHSVAPFSQSTKADHPAIASCQASSSPAASSSSNPFDPTYNNCNPPKSTSSTAIKKAAMRNRAASAMAVEDRRPTSISHLLLPECGSRQQIRPL
ncbi:hypothetical protein ACLOJK_034802, partial [Asimina triloba]